MTQPDKQSHRHLQDVLAQVQAALQKREVVTSLVDKQDMPRHDLVQTLVWRQQSSLLGRLIERLHPADTAFVLENLPLEQRRQIWELTPRSRRGAVLLELAEAVRGALIAEMNDADLLHAAGQLPADEIADLVPDLPQDLVPQLLESLATKNRHQVQAALNFPPDSVGALMDFDFLTGQLDATLGELQARLRRYRRLPEQIQQIFIVDEHNRLHGSLPLQTLLTHAPDTPVKTVLHDEVTWFSTTDQAEEAARAFDRYDLLSAPVVNAHGQLVGHLAVDAVLEFIHEESRKDLLNQAGLREGEDLFAPLWHSYKNRWVWLGLNLLTAFVAAKVIGIFEQAISQMAALAVLMPIVASTGGNTGNQTIALIIRGLALNQISRGNLARLFFKELGIAVLNGLIWGCVVALFAYVLYQNALLSLVMLIAMCLNLLVAAGSGVLIPLALKKLGRDPVMGSSIFLTALTDSMGFFIFLGLAQWALLR